MLSRHLYRVDEVRASLRYCLMKRNHTEACFWALELLDSLLFSEILEDCLWVWVYGIGIRGLDLLDTIEALFATEDISAEDVMNLVHVIARWPARDTSVRWLLEQGLTDTQPDTLVRKGEGCPVTMAILQGKVVLAWCLLRCRWEKDAADFLRSDIVFPEFLRTTFPWEVRALWVLVTSWKIVKKTTTTVIEPPQNILDSIQQWKDVEGRRVRRIYEIRSEAIQYGTERSFAPNTSENLKELREPQRGLEGTPFWETVAEDMGGWKRIRRNDDIKESFYDLYFPDDIPDEWSLADQRKSHGYGLFAATSSRINQYNKNMRNLFRGIGVCGMESWSVLSRPDEDEYAVLYEKGCERWATTMNGWDLRPRKKKLCVR